jgi:7-cyano-7-deazaguanine synthase
MKNGRGEKAVVCLSGGMDSVTLLHHLLEEGYDVAATVAVNYGQRHARELHFAQRAADKLGVRHIEFDLRTVGAALTRSCLTNQQHAVPHGHYEAESMKLTVVPNRNMLLLALSTAVAIDTQSGIVAYAAHGGDHAIYPDCRPEFMSALRQAITLADDEVQVSLMAPFAADTKAGIARIGGALGIDYGRETWSCYEGGNLHCGRCGTCVERREALEIAGVADTTMYALDVR